MVKILLTGASGMVGKNILEHPDSIGYEFLTPSSKELNLKNYIEVNEYLKNNKPNLIIHAAGKVGGIQANIAEPVSFLIDNLEIGKNIVLASKENNINQFINLGSSCMYPRNAKNPLKEEFILKGELEPTNEGYALSKIMTSKLCDYISKEDNSKDYKTIIPCNLYGRHDKFDPKNSHMIPAVIRKVYEAKENNSSIVKIWGDGLARREFMYAGDLADFIFFAIKNYSRIPKNINVGLGTDYSITDYYKIISKVLGYNGEFKYDLSKPTGMKQKLMDNSKIKKLGWSPKTSLENGVKQTLKFYKNI